MLMINKKLKIGCDIDEVVVGFMEKYLDFHNKKYNTYFNLNDFSDHCSYKSKVHKTKEKSMEDFLEFQNSEDFNKIDFIEGAKDSLEEFFYKYDLYFITSRPLYLKEKTFNFFSKYFPDQTLDIFFTEELCGGGFTKEKVCKNLNINFMIEDNKNYAFNCAKERIKVFLIDRPWNKNIEYNKDIIRVKNLNEVLRKLENEN